MRKYRYICGVFQFINTPKMRKLTTSELNRLELSEYRIVEKIPVVIVVDNVRSLNNVGSFFRTADAFRISRLYLCGITACPPHREIHKTALGAEESVEWRYFKTTAEACESLKNEGFDIFAVEQVEGSTMLADFDIKPNSAFVFGNEVDGVSEEALPYCKSAVEIPQAGTKHSLNVSVSAGIVMYEIFRKLFG